MPSLADRACETTTTTGTGALTLVTSEPNFRRFNHYLADGDTCYYVIKHDSGNQWETGIGTYNSGDTLTRSVVKYSSNSDLVVDLSAGTKLVFIDATYDSLIDMTRVGNYLQGAELSNNSGTPNTVIDVSDGWVMNSTNTFLMTIASTNKVLQSSGAWSANAAGNGLDTGARANSTWYHVFVIAKAGGYLPDVLFSTSVDSPTMPSGYTLKRRIGSIRTNGSGNIIKFWQYRDEFTWDVPVADVTATTPGSSAVTRTLTVPTGLKVKANVSVACTSTTTADVIGGVYLSDLDSTDTASSVNVFNPIYGYHEGVANFQYSAVGYCWTNTSAQIRSRCQLAGGASSVLYINTNGWIDRRGT